MFKQNRRKGRVDVMKLINVYLDKRDREMRERKKRDKESRSRKEVAEKELER